ncbi:MAG TPA: DUF2726 domain-containing protein [Paucimonas sp.]|nr:DUF2726 domain-containing protein [Paucimonas sp.]
MEPAKAALIIFSLLAIGAVVAYLKSRKSPDDHHAYVRRRPMKSYEQALYWRLVKTLPEHVVLAQVAMKKCVSTKGPNAAALAHESLDFVICNKAMRILAVIEIEDESRPMSDYRQKVEQLKEEALDAAGINLIKCSPTGLLSEAYIAMEFATANPETRLAA